MLTDGRRTDGRTTDAGVTGILIAHLGAFGSGELMTSLQYYCILGLAEIKFLLCIGWRQNGKQWARCQGELSMKKDL